MTHPIRSLTLLVAISAATPLVAGELAPALKCLPAETVAVMRMPSGNDFIQKLGAGTQLGSRMFSAERLAKLRQDPEQGGSAAWHTLMRQLRALGISEEDAKHLLDGEVGYAVAALPREDRKPVLLGLFWCRPGEPIAEKIFQAYAAVGDAENSPVRRQKIDLSDIPVIHLTTPVYVSLMEMGVVGRDPPSLKDTSTQFVKDQVHCMVAQVGDRFLMAHTFAQSSGGAHEPGDAKDLDAVTGVAQVRAALERFLVAQTSGGVEDSFLDRAQAVQGLEAALPTGDIGVEIYLDVDALPVRMILDSTADASESFRMVLELFGAGLDEIPFGPLAVSSGLDGLGFTAMRKSLDGNVVRVGAFVQADAPRKGLLTLLDQTGREPGPPTWAPADVMQYTELTMDLGELYRQLKRMLVESFDEGMEANLGIFDDQAALASGLTMGDLLSSLGTRHMLFVDTPTSVMVPGIGGEQREQLAGRWIMAWTIADEQPWEQVMQFVGAMAGMMGGGLVYTEEQEFIGWRFNMPVHQGGLFLGRGHLVVAYGEGMADRALSAIANPPEGEAALVNHERFTGVSKFIKPQPALLFQVTDAGRLVSLQMPSARFRAYPRIDKPSQPGAFTPLVLMNAAMAFLNELRPLPDQMADTFGASAMQVYANDAGLIVDAANELLPPQ